MLEYKVIQKEEQVVLIGADGLKRNYVLREFDGDAKDAYMQDSADRVTIKDGKVDSINRVAGVEIFLIQLCMYDDKAVNVTKEFIGALPSQVVDGLYMACRELNALTKDEVDAAKNDSEATS